MRSLTLCFLLLWMTTGCAKKATYIPNGSGGYTLISSTTTMQHALIRINRTAEDLCGSRYTMTKPIIRDTGWRASARGGGTVVTVEVDLACQGGGTTNSQD